jgi:hypothetical protein
MLYLIGGVARSGKTRLARMLLRRRAIPFMPLDPLVDMVRSAAPDVGVRNWGRGKAETFAPFLRALVFHLPWTAASYCLEGNAFWPDHVGAIREAASWAPTAENERGVAVRVVFLGFSDISLDELRKPPSWLSFTPADRHETIREELLEESLLLRDSCQEHGCRYFDVISGDESSLTAPYDFLTADQARPL